MGKNKYEDIAIVVIILAILFTISRCTIVIVSGGSSL